MNPLDELVRLSTALDVRAREVREWEAWYDGDHPIPEPPPNTAAAVAGEARQAFETMARLAVTNFIPPTVNTPASKARVEGFRFSESPNTTDADAWAIWSRNHMVGDWPLATEAAFKSGAGYALVWVDNDNRASITVEDPEQTIVAYEAGTRRRRRSALKRWVDEDGYVCATLYTAAAVYKWRSTQRVHSELIIPGLEGAATTYSSGVWQRREVPGEPWPLPNPFGEVPMVEARWKVPLKSERLLFGGGPSIFAGVLNEQRKINQSVMLLLTTMENQSFRQRWATDWDYPTNDDGSPDRDAMIRASAARLMVFNGMEEGSQPRVGEFAQADFRPFRDILEMWAMTMATTTALPPYAFLVGHMDNVSDDLVARIEAVHLGNMETYADSLGQASSDITRLALKIEGNAKAKDPVITTVWGEFERRTATEQADMALKAKEIGAPKAAYYAMFPGVDQSEALRWEKAELTDQMRSAAVGAEPVVAVADDAG